MLCCFRAAFSVPSHFNFEKGETRAPSAARPEASEKTAFFPRNDRPYGLKCEAFQTENALKKACRCFRICLKKRAGEGMGA